MKLRNVSLVVGARRVLALSLGLALVACGGGEEAAQSAPTPAAAPREAATALAAPAATGRMPRARQLRGVTAIDVAPDGSVASAAADGSVQLQGEGNSAASAMAEATGMATTGLAFSADGQRLVSVSRDSVVRVWNVGTRSRVLTLQGHEHPIRTVATSADGSWVASAGEEARVMLWDARTGRLARVLGGHGGFVNGLAFSPDGRVLAAAEATGKVVLWNLANGVPRHRLAGHADEVNAVAFSPDGTLVVTAGEDGRVMLWSADNGQQLQVLGGHQGAVRSVAFSRDGRWLASAGADSTVQVWDAGSRTLARTLATAAPVSSLVFDIRRRRDVLLVGDESGRVTRWDVARGQPR